MKGEDVCATAAGLPLKRGLISASQDTYEGLSGCSTASTVMACGESTATPCSAVRAR